MNGIAGGLTNDESAELNRRMHEWRVGELINQMREQQRFAQAMEAWRRLTHRPQIGEAPSALAAMPRPGATSRFASGSGAAHAGSDLDA